MPVTLVDRLPLPNLKVYTAGSVLLVSVSVYYAMSVTGDPNWRVNSTVPSIEPSNTESEMMQPLLLEEQVPALNNTLDQTVSEHFLKLMTFMMQEPLCMWTLINLAYCSLALFGVLIQHVVFGKLRVSEAQRIKDKFWNYVFYKFIFVFGVINVQYMDEVLLWCSWFTLLGFLQLMAQLCKDRYDYLAFSPNTSKWAHVRLLSLLSGIIAASIGMLVLAFMYGLPAGKDAFACMAAECLLVLLTSCHVVARYVLQATDTEPSSQLAYYTHLVFDSVSLSVECCHVAHLVVWSRLGVSLASLVLLLQLQTLLAAARRAADRHRRHAWLRRHADRTYPLASAEEVEAISDNCAICWEPMKEARKLPCMHLFHSGCLTQWLQQDASCPTCRRALPPVARTHTLRIDGSRYLSWLPRLSVEVTRVDLSRVPQVREVFPASTNTLASEIRHREPSPAAPEPRSAPREAFTQTEERHEAPSPHSSTFASFPAERELLLRRRKQLLLAAARERFLARSPP